MSRYGGSGVVVACVGGGEGLAKVRAEVRGGGEFAGFGVGGERGGEDVGGEVGGGAGAGRGILGAGVWR